MVDLWGGFPTESRELEWTDKALVNFMSVTKGVVAIAAQLDKPVELQSQLMGDNVVGRPKCFVPNTQSQCE